MGDRLVGYTFEACIRGGTRRCDVEEVDVLGTVVVEVVAHGDGSGSSGSHFVVVHTP